MKEQSFLGKGWSFPPEFKIKKGDTTTCMVENEEDIRQSLYILMNTTPGERIHQLDFGCEIRKYVFEVMDLATQTLMREAVERAIILFESRIALEKVTIDVNQNEGIVWIVLDYTIRQTNQRSNMVYPFYLSEGTDITL